MKPLVTRASSLLSREMFELVEDEGGPRYLKRLLKDNPSLCKW